MAVNEIRLMGESMSHRELAKKVSGRGGVEGWKGLWQVDQRCSKLGGSGHGMQKAVWATVRVTGWSNVHRAGDGAALPPTCCQAMTSKGTGLQVGTVSVGRKPERWEPGAGDTGRSGKEAAWTTCSPCPAVCPNPPHSQRRQDTNSTHRWQNRDTQMKTRAADTTWYPRTKEPNRRF